jgi:hypothetical protein
MDFTGIDGIVTVSGDGLFYEVLNGIMSRPDWENVIKIPLGIIPGKNILNFSNTKKRIFMIQQFC